MATPHPAPMQCSLPGKRRGHRWRGELPDGIGDPAPRRGAPVIAFACEVFGARGVLFLGFIAVASEQFDGVDVVSYAVTRENKQATPNYSYRLFVNFNASRDLGPI